MTPEGESLHEQTQVESTRREREGPGEEGEEIKCPKREVIRVESEEMQDYVKESLDLSREEAEEISFVPSAISVPQRPLFRCDNRCSDKTLSFWQFASVVMKGCEESYTTNLCQQCSNKMLVARGDKPLEKWQWYEVVEKKTHRGRLWRMLGKDQYVQEMWEYYSWDGLKSNEVSRGGRERKAGRDTRPMAT